MSGEPTRKKIIPGEYKTMPNNVRLSNGEIFEYAAPEDVLPKMQELLDWYNGVGEQDPIEVAALLHYRFVCIHPFDDGNGRVSRLLLNYHLLRAELPPVIIKSKDKTAYLNALNEADTGDVAAFIAYIREQMLWSLELSIKAAQGEAVDESGDWKKKLDVLNKKLDVNKSNVIPYSKDVVIERYFSNIHDLFTALEKDVFEDISAMFYENKRSLTVGRMEVQGNYKSNSNMNKITTHLETEDIREIWFRCDWKGFKKNGANTFDCYDSVRITFNDFNYEVYHQQTNKVVISKTYSEPLSEEDMTFIKNKVGENSLFNIESRINLHK
jgi:hypothetical protein